MKSSVIKICNSCHRVLSEDDFGWINKKKTKRKYKCKKCENNYVYLWAKSKGLHPGPVGRPKGFKLSENTKSQISKTRTGSFQNWSTKDKISNSLLCYFREKNSLSDEMSYIYKNCCGWIKRNKDEINAFEDVKTDSRMRTISSTEIAVDYIEEIAINYDDPEVLLLRKEESLMYP